ncbi:MAG: glutamine amidotransferase [Firmicutes bacterium]|nr:glutamine amidotransferase [Bacillota bacterium]
MVEQLKVLIAGESWVTTCTHIKGFDVFVNSNYEEGVEWLKKGLEENGVAVDYLPNHVAARKFPTTMEELRNYDVVILSDIGANTLLLHPDTFTKSIPTPNRLGLLKDYVASGGGLCMIGGYLTFQGIEAKGAWRGTQVEEILPVNLLPGDDRVEVPESFSPRIVGSTHPVLRGIPQKWPIFLGYNRLIPKPEAVVLAEHNEDPFIAVMQYAGGRTMAFASDCSPHWGPPGFTGWKYYPTFWAQAVKWLAGRD